MSASTTIRSGFKIIHHVVPASTPSFRLACNNYRRTTPLITKDSLGVSTPPIIFTHANGFHKEIWEPVISRLSSPWANSDMYAFDCRNQGDSAVLNKSVLEKQFNWYSYAEDILKIVDTFGLKKTIGIGHSFGASAFILAEVMRPGTFSAIVAVDPTMFPKEVNMSASFDDHPMAQLTIKRRDTWKSREECKANLLKKKFFSAWHPEALDLYIEHGMLDVVNDDGSAHITLKCPKFQEAVTFAMVGNGIYDAYERLNEVQVPIHIVSGEDSDINPRELVEIKAARCKYGSLEIVKDAGHLVSLEKPQETGAEITEDLYNFGSYTDYSTCLTEKVVEAYNDRHSSRIRAVHVDVNKQPQCQLPSCIYDHGFFELASEDDFQKVMDVNYRSVVRIIKVLLPSLRIYAKSQQAPQDKRLRCARLLTITSIVGISNVPARGGYCGSKYAKKPLLETPLRIEISP
ncbi:hypothetical protein FBU30_004375 [Linnemannia zychae]|nr:hypothetical protein FBU30_004375 [Linnemannia zychae]